VSILICVDHTVSGAGALHVSSMIQVSQMGCRPVAKFWLVLRQHARQKGSLHSAVVKNKSPRESPNKHSRTDR